MRTYTYRYASMKKSRKLSQNYQQILLFTKSSSSDTAIFMIPTTYDFWENIQTPLLNWSMYKTQKKEKKTGMCNTIDNSSIRILFLIWQLMLNNLGGVPNHGLQFYS